MNLLTLLSDRGVLERGRVPEIEVELAKPEAKPEEVLQKAGVALKDILKAKGEYYGIPTLAEINVSASRASRLSGSVMPTSSAPSASPSGASL